MPRIKFQGELNLKYQRHLPWYTAGRSVFRSSVYCEMSGHDRYTTTRDEIPFEEIVVFSEALCKEGAEIRFEL